MSNRKRPNAAKKKSTKRGHSGLATHRREGKQLTAPMNTVGPTTSIPWLRDVFPHMLWMCAVLSEHGIEEGTRVVIGVIDGLDPWTGDTTDSSSDAAPFSSALEESIETNGESSPSPLLDGTLGGFDLIKESDRAEVMSALRADGLYDDAFPPWFVAALSRYDSVPGAWILAAADRGTVGVNAEEVEQRLRQVAVDAWHGRTEIATRTKMLLARAYLRAGRLFLDPSDSSLPRLLADYPHRLDSRQRQMAEGTMRATFLALWGHRPETGAAEAGWPARFWRRNWALFDCVSSTPDLDAPAREDRSEGTNGNIDGRETNDPSGPQDDPETESNEREAWARAQQVWASHLEEIEQRFLEANRGADPDLFSPDRNEILTGITSRNLRAIQAMVRLPGLWSVEHGSSIIRGLVEGRIVQKWLIHKNDPDLFRKFKQYGLGHLKLHILHLREYAESTHGSAEGLEETIAGLEELLERDVMEEFQDISVDANFTSTNTRQMAIAVGLEREYRLVFAPSSANVHSEWIALEQYALTPCGNPLHRGHRRVVKADWSSSVVSVRLGTLTFRA